MQRFYKALRCGIKVVYIKALPNIYFSDINEVVQLS